MWQIVRELVANGVTIFLTTQYLEEADELADRIALLDHGRLIAEGTADELKRLVPGGHVRLRFADPDDVASAVRALPDAALDDDELVLRVPGDGGVRSMRDMFARLDDLSIEVEELSVHTPDLDDVFLTLTSRKETTR